MINLEVTHDYCPHHQFNVAEFNTTTNWRSKRRRMWLSWSQLISQALLVLVLIQLFYSVDGSGSGSGSDELKYIWGDAFTDPDALGPDGNPYPWDTATQIAGKSRIPRSLGEETSPPPPLLTPEETRAALLNALNFDPPSPEERSFLVRNASPRTYHRKGRSETTTTTTTTSSPSSGGGGGCVPPRLCETTYNTTAPMYGISLTSGNPVTIVQKFPDLLQQVVYQVCKSTECDVIQGECVQTYLPYLFLVIPLGPVTLTGQDYVLVESGCTCRPKYAKREENQPPLPFIAPFNNTGANKNAPIPANNKPRINKRF